MKAAVLYQKDDIRIEDIEIPVLQPNEVLVQVKATGICGSDLPRVLGDAAHHYPIVLGHEFSGIVHSIGSEVSRVKAGDRVIGVPLLPCRECPDCLSGNFAQCKHYSFIGSRVNGSWAEYVKMPADNAIPFDDSLSFEEAALVEPSAVALHALQIISYQSGEHVAVLGGGNIGLLVLQWAKLLGASTVTVFDIDDDRLDIARRLGADYTVNTSGPAFMAASVIKDITGGRGFGIVMETAGANATMQLCFELAANKAKLCFVGTTAKDLTFPHKLFEQMNRKEFTLTGSWMSYSAPFPGCEWEMTLQYLRQGQLNLKDIVFAKYELTDINKAFDLFRQLGAVKGKILLINS